MYGHKKYFLYASHRSYIHLGRFYFLILQYFIDITESVNIYKVEMMIEEDYRIITEVANE
jgi:hypothetical protein